VHPWQERTRGCGLALHGALDLAIDAPRLQADFATLDRDLAADARHHTGGTCGWTSVPLLQRRSAGTPAPTPALAMMPSVSALLAQTDWRLRGAYLLRQGPGDVLRWHFDNQALHLEEARLLIPIAVPPAAVTWIGHEAVAYPAGHGWTGDFSLPHQVDNPSTDQRVILAFDVEVTPALLRLFPPALAADRERRWRLAETCRNLLLTWRAAQQ
jgi:hypothetical protein